MPEPLFRPALAVQRYRLASSVASTSDADIFIDAGCNVGNLLKTVMASQRPMSCHGPSVVIGLDISQGALKATGGQLSSYEKSVLRANPSAAANNQLDDANSSRKFKRKGSGYDEEWGEDSTDDVEEGDPLDDDQDVMSCPAADDDYDGAEHTTALSYDPLPSILEAGATPIASAYVALLQCDFTHSLDVSRWPREVVDCIVRGIAVRLDEKYRRHQRDARIAQLQHDMNQQSGRTSIATTGSNTLMAPPRLTEVPMPRDSAADHDVDPALFYLPSGTAMSSSPMAVLPLSLVITNVEVIEHIAPLLLEEVLDRLMVELPSAAVMPWAEEALAMAKGWWRDAAAAAAACAHDDASTNVDQLLASIDALTVQLNVSFVLTTPNGEMNELIRVRSVINQKAELDAMEEGDNINWATEAGGGSSKKDGHAKWHQHHGKRAARPAGSEVERREQQSPWYCQYRNLRHNDHYFELKVDAFGHLVDFLGRDGGLVAASERLVASTEARRNALLKQRTPTRSTIEGCLEYPTMVNDDDGCQSDHLGSDGSDERLYGIIGAASVERVGSVGHISNLLGRDVLMPASLFDDPSAVAASSSEDNDPFMCASHAFVAKYTIGAKHQQHKQQELASTCSSSAPKRTMSAAETATAAAEFPFAAIFGSPATGVPPLGDAACWDRLMTHIDRARAIVSLLNNTAILNIESNRHDHHYYHSLLVNGELRQIMANTANSAAARHKMVESNGGGMPSWGAASSTAFGDGPSEDHGGPTDFASSASPACTQYGAPANSYYDPATAYAGTTVATTYRGGAPSTNNGYNNDGESTVARHTISGATPTPTSAASEAVAPPITHFHSFYTGLPHNYDDCGGDHYYGGGSGAAYGDARHGDDTATVPPTNATSSFPEHHDDDDDEAVEKDGCDSFTGSYGGRRQPLCPTAAAPLPQLLEERYWSFLYNITSREIYNRWEVVRRDQLGAEVDGYNPDDVEDDYYDGAYWNWVKTVCDANDRHAAASAKNAQHQQQQLLVSSTRRSQCQPHSPTSRSHTVANTVCSASECPPFNAGKSTQCGDEEAPHLLDYDGGDDEEEEGEDCGGEDDATGGDLTSCLRYLEDVLVTSKEKKKANGVKDTDTQHADEGGDAERDSSEDDILHRRLRVLKLIMDRSFALEDATLKAPAATVYYALLQVVAHRPAGDANPNPEGIVGEEEEATPLTTHQQAMVRAARELLDAYFPNAQQLPTSASHQQPLLLTPTPAATSAAAVSHPPSHPYAQSSAPPRLLLEMTMKEWLLLLEHQGHTDSTHHQQQQRKESSDCGTAPFVAPSINDFATKLVDLSLIGYI